jgi:hypothetical protein
MKESRANMVSLNMYWGRQRFYYDVDNNVEYICRHYSLRASGDLPDWVIWRHYYTDGNLVDVQKLVGALDDRASLAWET